MREGVCFLWTQRSHALPACLAHILSWLWRRAVMHVWSQAKTDTQKSHNFGRREPCIFWSSELHFCLTKMLIRCHSSTRMKYLLMTKHTSRNRPRIDGLLLNICSPRLTEGSQEIWKTRSLPPFYASSQLFTSRSRLSWQLVWRKSEMTHTNTPVPSEPYVTAGVQSDNHSRICSQGASD